MPTYDFDDPPGVSRSRTQQIENVKTLRRYATTLYEDAHGVVAMCERGDLDERALCEQLHAIDRSAACLRHVVARVSDSSR